MSTDNLFSLADRRVLVTGASRGIGLGIARGMLRAGAEVILCARSQADLELAAAALRVEFPLASIPILRPLDVTILDTLPDWHAQLTAEFGPVDVLVNAAGTTMRGMALEQPLSDFALLQTLNVTAPYELARLCARRLIAEQRPGRIINIASLMTFASRPGTAAYTASKGAIGQLTKSLAIEWGPFGITVNAIAPGYIATPLTAGLQADPAFDAWVKQRCPLHRWGTPDDLAGPAVMLASDAGRFVNGHVLTVDGGWMAGL